MTKTLKISEKVHQKLKIHCAETNTQIGKWAEECLIAGMKVEKVMENFGGKDLKRKNKIPNKELT